MSGLATRLYRGEAGVDVVGKRKVWFTVAGVVLLIAIITSTAATMNQVLRRPTMLMLASPA